MLEGVKVKWKEILKRYIPRYILLISGGIYL